VTINVKLCANNFNNNNSIPRRDSEFWARRRRWWAAEAKRQGCDWPGVARTILAVDDYLADLRKRRAA
jgi:hypothetical protein